VGEGLRFSIIKFGKSFFSAFFVSGADKGSAMPGNQHKIIENVYGSGSI